MRGIWKERKNGDKECAFKAGATGLHFRSYPIDHRPKKQMTKISLILLYPDPYEKEDYHGPGAIARN